MYIWFFISMNNHISGLYIYFLIFSWKSVEFGYVWKELVSYYLVLSKDLKKFEVDDIGGFVVLCGNVFVPSV